MKKILKLVNVDPAERVQDRDRWEHVLPGVQAERPKGTFFYDRIYALWTEPDGERRCMLAETLVKEANKSWQTLLECWCAAGVAAKFIQADGENPDWVVELADICRETLKHKWKSCRHQWRKFVRV